MLSLLAITSSPSKTFVAVTGAFCLGILLGPLFASVSWTWFLALLVILAGSVFVARHRHDRVLSLIVLALVFGIFRFNQALPPPGAPTVIDEPERFVRVAGLISGEVETRVSSQRALLRDVSLADQPRWGRVLVYLPQSPRFAPGDRLVFNCSLKRPEPIESFRYDLYLSSKNILAVCYFPDSIWREAPQSMSLTAAILSIKDFLVNRLRLIFSEPHAAFLSGLLFGGSSSLSRGLQDDFSRTGTSHILAASGFNVSLISFVFLSWILTTRFGRRPSLILTAVLIGVYVVMAGATPAVWRAALMAYVVLASFWIRRQPHLPNLFLLALSGVLLINPKVLMADPGFQLSFAATFAILYLAPRWEKYLAFLPKTLGLRPCFAGSLAAIFLTSPIVLWHFGAFSAVAPLANFLILPAIPYLMAATLLALAASFLILPLAVWLALPAFALSFLILHAVVFFGALPFAVLKPASAHYLALISAVVILFLLWRFPPRAARKFPA